MAKVTILKDNRLVRMDKEEFERLYKGKEKQLELPVEEVVEPKKKTKKK